MHGKTVWVCMDEGVGLHRGGGYAWGRLAGKHEGGVGLHGGRVCMEDEGGMHEKGGRYAWGRWAVMYGGGGRVYLKEGGGLV